MSEPLLNVMKIMLLAGLYLFFVRVLWSVMNELRDPRRAAARQPEHPPAATLLPAHPAPAMAQAGGAMRGAASRGAPPVVPDPVYSGPPSAPVMGVAGRLTVVAPAKRVGIAYTLGPQITIGRATTNGISLDDTYVSTVHARIFATNDRYFVEDLGSRNGTLLDGQPLTATTALSPGDRLTFGATTLEFS